MADRTNRQAEVTVFGPGDKQITSTTSGAKELLDVFASATITNNESPTKYQLKTDYEADTGTSLNTSTDTTLYTYTGDGVLSFVAVTNPTTANFEVTIDIDGTERLRINMGDLGSVLGLTQPCPIWTQTANKQFRYHPTPEIGFSTSFAIKAKATVSTTTVYHLVMFKERVD